MTDPTSVVVHALRVARTAMFAAAMIPFASPPARGQEPLDLAREASLAVRSNLRSGLGEGVLELARRPAPGEELRVESRARAKLAFDGDKFRVELDYEIGGDRAFKGRRMVLVGDGSATYIARFTDLIQPAKSGADVFEPGDVIRAGLEFNPAFPHQELDFVKILEHVPEDQVDFQPVDGDDAYLWRYVVPGKNGIYSETRMSAASGYNLSDHVTYAAAGEPSWGERHARWAERDGVWYVQAYSYEQRDGRETPASTRLSLELSEFEPNAEVDPSLFTIDSLGLTEGAYIDDRRRGASPDEFLYTKSVETTEEELDLLAQQARLPPVPDAGTPATEAEPRLRPWVAWVLVLAAVLAVGGILWRWRRWHAKA